MMTSPESSGGGDHADVSHDSVREAFDGIWAILNMPDKRKLKVEHTNIIKTHFMKVHCEYLNLVEKVKQLELTASVHASCRELSQQPSSPGLSNQNNNRSYAAAVGGVVNKPSFDPLCVLQVFPKQPPDSPDCQLKSAQATKQLLECLDLKGKKVGIKHIKTVGGNGVSVLCRDRGDVDVLTKVIDDQKGDVLKTKTIEKRKPAVTMLLRGRDWDMKELEADILAKNDFLVVDEDDDSSIRIASNYPTAHGNTIVVMEVVGRAFKAIVENGSKLFVGWTCVSVREQDPISQCRKCQRYGHKAPKCRHNVNGEPATRCAQCSLHHAPNIACTGAPCCANCKDFNVSATKRGWGTVETRHSAKDPKCPMRIKAFDRARTYIDYD